MHEQWKERMMGQLELSLSKISYNRNKKTTDKQLWGGTGIIIQNTTTQRLLGWGEDPRKLGRWT